MIELRDQAMVWQYLHHELGLHASEDFRGVIFAPDEVRGRTMRMDDVGVAVGFTGFVGKACCVHTVIKRPELVTRSVLRDVFNYPFNIAGCEVVLATIDSTNTAALRLNRKLGFKDVVTFPGAGLDGDLVLLALSRDDCRWIRKEH